MPRTPVPFLSLPADTLGIVHRILGTNDLSSTSKTIWQTLRMQNRKVIVTDENVDSLLRAINEPMVSLQGTHFVIPAFTRLIEKRIHALYASFIGELTITGGNDMYTHPFVEDDYGTLEGALNGLQYAAHLHTLRLNFDHVSWGRLRLETSLSALKHAPALEVLYLDLGDTHISPDDAAALALARAVKDAPHIRVLSIDLKYSDIGEDGAKALSTLKDSKTLEALHINLRNFGHRGPYGYLEWLVSLGTCQPLQALRLGLHGNALHLEPKIRTHLARLGASRLRTLHLELGDNQLEFEHIKELCAIRLSPLLETLHIDLQRNKLCSRACEALVALVVGSPALRNLTLNLEENDIGDKGVEFLGQLTSLRALTLWLGSNGISDEGARALARLSSSSTLTTLDLQFCGNNNTSIGDGGIAALSALQNIHTLHTLRLDLRSMNIGDIGFGGLVYPPMVHKLYINLQNTDVGKAGVVGLVDTLRRLPLLSDLYLDLSGNFDERRMGNDCMESLSALSGVPHLRVLTLDLSDGLITYMGARALGRLSNAPFLHTLKLILGNNYIGDSGAAELTSLKDAPALQTLHLELESNLISRSGVEALANLYDDRSALRSLVIKLDRNTVTREDCNQALRGLKDKPNLHFRLAWPLVEGYAEDGPWEDLLSTHYSFHEPR